MIRIMMTAAFALAATTAPAIAQTTDGQTTGSGSMAGAPQTDSMSNSPVNPGAPNPTMSKSQMAMMKRCQSSEAMMKSKKCMKMQSMQDSSRTQ